jgi:predicted dehydrogenase
VRASTPLTLHLASDWIADRRGTLRIPGHLLVSHPTDSVRVGIVGCGRAARIHAARLKSSSHVAVVGCADLDVNAAAELAAHCGGDGPVPSFGDHRALLAEAAPDAVAIFTPHRAHYRPAMDALQAGCHVFVEKPLSTNAQEAADIAALARARGRVVAVGHQYRLRPALLEARRLLAEGAIGVLRLVVATLAAPWLAQHGEPEDAWRLDPKQAGGGVLADAGDHLLDALIWTTGRTAAEVAAFQAQASPGLDVVAAAALRLADGTPATLAVSGVAHEGVFELTYHGEQGRLWANAGGLRLERAGQLAQELRFPEPERSIDADFVEAIRTGRSPCCPVEEAVETVRLLEAVVRSAASAQIVRLT